MKRNFTRLFLLAVLMMCCTVMANAQAQAPAGDGSKGNPYKITNFYQLYWFSLKVYQENIYACAILMNDIERDNTAWVPIGYDDNHVYCGEFNGNGHVIKGLHNTRDEHDAYSVPAHKDKCLGLFGKIDKDGSVHDVGVENCDFYGHDRVGAICGDLARGEVYNCWSSGYICVNSAAGGLVGSCWFNSKLRNCYTSCNVVVSEWTDQYVGGVCGSVAGKVENCFMLEKTDGWAEKPIGAPYGDTYVISNVAAKPNGAFSSGEVCWLLNGGVTNGSQGWYQTLGTDNMPTLSKSSKTVSRYRAKCTSDNYIYNNDKVEMDANHALAYRPKYSCASTGYDTEYWECLGCHKLFSDRECTHEINQSDLGEIETAIIITKDADWQYADKLRPDGCNTTLNSCYYIDIPAPEPYFETETEMKFGTKTTSISFTVNTDDCGLNLIWFYNQWGIYEESTYEQIFSPDATTVIKYMVNGETKKIDTFGKLEGRSLTDHVLRSDKCGTKLDFGHLKKGDVVKIEIDLTRCNIRNNRNNLIVFSVVPTHKFKHVNATSLYREHWECEYCHNLFTSNAHPDSDEDICSLDDLTYEQPTKNDGYYEIRNQYTLYWLAREVNENGKTAIKARLTADITVNNNVLDQNGNLNDASSFRTWTPIGNDEHPFTGEFDGNGHTIRGLYQKDSNQDAGLFGYMTTGGKIENVIVKDSYLFGQFPGNDGDTQGTICSRNWGGRVSDSYISMGKVYGGYVYVSVSENDKYHTYVTDAQFNSGDATWMLNGEKIGTKWRQQIGRDPYPVFMIGNYLVNHSVEKEYYNETMCDKSENGVHNLTKVDVKKCDNTTLVYWHCNACGKDFTDADRTKEEAADNKFSHCPKYVNAILPTSTIDGHYGHYQCTKCGGKFKDESCSQSWTNDNELIVHKSKNTEIWYSSTNNQKIDPNITNVFGATIKDNKYEYGLGVITFDNDVTSIGNKAYYKCGNLQSISIPSSVTKIGNEAFEGCGSLLSANIPSDSKLTSIGESAFSSSGLLQINIPSGVTYIGAKAFQNCVKLQTVTFKSLPELSNTITAGVSQPIYVPFWNCGNLTANILDLTDSEKPYIGTSLANYLGFTGAHYHRTLEPGKWGTIVLPFAPTDGMDGLEFYKLKEMTLRQTQGEPGNGGSLVFTKVETVKAGVPYLFRNTSSTSDFTLTKNEKPAVTVSTTDQTVGDFTLKGSFKQTSLNTTEKKNDNLYYLKDNEFFHANGKINIAPFRAYIEGSGTSGVKSFMLVVSDNGEDITAIPGIMDEDGTLDETEAIYDLSGRRLAALVKGQINIIRTKSGKTIKRLF